MLVGHYQGDTVISAELSSPSQGANQSPNPTKVKSRSDTPHNGYRMSCHTKPMITTDKSVGRKKIVR